MTGSQRGAWLAGTMILALAAAPAAAQAPADDVPIRSLSDSLQWARAKGVADRSTGRRVVVSLVERRLWWISGRDTLLTAPVAVGTGDTLSFGDARWKFETPRGVRTVVGKQARPVWVPPMWHFVESARKSGRRVVELERGRPFRLADGSQVVIRGRAVGQQTADGRFTPVEPGNEVAFDDIVFVPPFGTVNREVPGELGPFKLDMGDGYLIHGTPHKDSIGTAATHGCIRVDDAALERLFREVPVGTRVYIY